MVNWKPLTTHHSRLTTHDSPLTILLLATCYLLLATDVAYSQKVIIGKPIARFGSIRVNSDPPGAEIYVDGIAKGFTPQVISHLSSGSYCVVIHKEDYIDVIRTAEVSAGTITEINVKLKSIIRPDMVYPLKGIMVTAERIKPIPVFGNIAFISENEIKTSSARTVPEILQRVAGVTIYKKGSEQMVSIRGLPEELSKYTLVLLDEVPINEPDGRVDWNLVPLSIVKKIEVIKGPVISIYSGKSLGGIIKIFTKQEKERYEQTMNLSCGMPQSYGGAFTSTGPIGIMNYWVALSGYKGNMGRDYSDYNKLNLFGKFMVPVDETTKLRLLLEILQMKQHLPGTLTEKEINEGAWKKTGEDSALNSYKTWWASTIYEKNMGEGNKLSMRFFHYTKQYINKIHQSDQSARLQNFGINAEYSFTKFGNTTCGFSWQWEDLNRIIFIPDSLDSLNQEKNDITSDIRWAVFIQQRWKPILNLHLMTGIRYDYMSSDIADFLFGGIFTEDYRRTITDSRLSPKLGIIYPLIFKSHLFANAGLVFRPPAGYQRMGNPDSLKPEKGTNYEIGIRRYTKNLHLSLAVYSMTIEDKIRYDYVNDKYENRDKAYHQGIEQELTLGPFGGFLISESYTITKATDNNGNYLPNVPKSKAFLELKYETPFYLIIGVETIWIDECYIDEENTPDFKLPSRLDTNLNVKYRRKRSEISLTINNLLNKEYKGYGYLNEEDNNPRYYPMPKINFRIGYNYQF